MNSIVKNILLVAGGSVVGFFTASIMAKKEYQGVIDALEKELNADAMKKREEKSKKRENREVKTYNKELLSAEDIEDYKETVNIYVGDKTEPVAAYTTVKLREDENPQGQCQEPYFITIEEFSEERPEFDKSTIYYYANDDILTDEDEEIMDDIEGTVGDEALDLFTSDDTSHTEGETVYVRNEKLSIDYEIIGLYGSYKEAMGITEDK